MYPNFKKTLLATLCLSAISTTASAVPDLLFSEYIEGSSFNKAIEIYNDTGIDIDLSTYKVEAYHNGSHSPSYSIDLNGSLANGAVFVLANPGSSSDILAQTDLETSSINFNGDDAIVLTNNGIVIDSIGQVGFDPGSEWGTGDTSTKDNTLQRAQLIADTNPFDAFDPPFLWTGYAQDTVADLGNFGSSNDGDNEPPPSPTQLVKIHEIQGEGSNSPLSGQTVSVEAIVTARLDDLNGFNIQEEAFDYDDSELSSEGIFVYAPNLSELPEIGDRVQLTAQVAEYYDLTQLKNIESISIVDGGNEVTPTEVTLPFASTDFMERYEGMLVSFAQDLTVTENYDLARYGQFWLSSGGRLQVPTNVVSPGNDALAMQQANDLNRILVDDNNSRQNPDPVIYPSPELSAYNTLRSGDMVTSLQGVVNYSYGNYQIQPTVTPQTESQNLRTLQPESIGGSLKIASFNVLNYFNGDGQGGGFPTSRGADNFEEFERQQEKIVKAILAMDVDIIGLMEIENDGYGEFSAIASLVKALNAEMMDEVYDFVNPGVSKIGTDEIAVGFIYRTDKVELSGKSAILDSSVNPEFIDDKNRPALAQTFVEKATNGIVTVSVNHLKSKGSSCDNLGDPDMNDGQGNCNQTRTKAAQALADWLSTDPTQSGDSDTLIIGDLNAYAKEDPISAIKGAGYKDLIDSMSTSDMNYSYVFYGQAGYLDHALSSESLTSQVSGVTEWHINADEPRALDYNLEYKSDNQDITFYNSDPYRASDHDPVIIGLDLEPSAKNIIVSNMETDVEWIGPGFSKRLITVTFQIENDLGEVVENANVQGSWSMRRDAVQASCTTNDQGICEVTLETRKKTEPYAFDINGIEHSVLIFDDQSSVTSIEVNEKPGSDSWFSKFVPWANRH
ncbi:ExeM/NucH family extracellular endonuclease [Thiomicrorhabdus indica]|uniref:ExeM/NucH family extracellular endonuclease n=1 Tax=Thiomicrorhabdus indica TaxID=2267253 RepID=UPI00102DECE5|nr:ExeM/NucH family extracellular endonuclease [Thiomicrorhabdus indica]